MVPLGEGAEEVLEESQGNVRKAKYGQQYPFDLGVYWVNSTFLTWASDLRFPY